MNAVAECTCGGNGVCTRCVLAGLHRDDWSVSADVLEQREAELARSLPPVDVEAGVEALRRGDFAEWAFEQARDHARALMTGSPVAVVEVPSVDVETCPRCGGWLMREVSDPLSARCMACHEPVRRIS